MVERADEVCGSFTPAVTPCKVYFPSYSQVVVSTELM